MKKQMKLAVMAVLASVMMLQCANSGAPSELQGTWQEQTTGLVSYKFTTGVEYLMGTTSVATYTVSQPDATARSMVIKMATAYGIDVSAANSYEKLCWTAPTGTTAGSTVKIRTTASGSTTESAAAAVACDATTGTTFVKQ